MELSTGVNERPIELVSIVCGYDSAIYKHKLNKKDSYGLASLI